MNGKKDHRYLSRNLTMVGAVFLAVSEAIDKDEGRL